MPLFGKESDRAVERHRSVISRGRGERESPTAALHPLPQVLVDDRRTVPAPPRVGRTPMRLT